MLQLNITCEDIEQGRSYLNGPQYLNLLSDLALALRNAQKYGTDADVLQVVANFYPNIVQAVDNSEGPY